MALKFKCDNCQQDMIVRAHKVGESAACGSCGRYSRVPKSAENVEEDETLNKDVQMVSDQDKANGVGYIPTSKTGEGFTTIEEKPISISVLTGFAWFSLVASVIVSFYLLSEGVLGVVWIFYLLLGGIFNCVLCLVIASIAENVFLIRCNTQKELSPDNSDLNSEKKQFK